MSNPDEKKLHTYQDWLTWDGAWELINGKAYNMSLTRQPFTSLLWGSSISRCGRTCRIRAVMCLLLRSTCSSVRAIQMMCLIM